MGDLNLNLLDQNSASAIDFLSMMLSLGIQPSVVISTWVTETHASLIDNIFSSLDLLEYLVHVRDVYYHFPAISLYKSADQTQRIASLSTLHFSVLVILSWVYLILVWLTSHGIVWFLNLILTTLLISFLIYWKKVSLKVCNQGPAPHTSERIAPLNPRMAQGFYRSWKREKLFVEALYGFISCSSSSTAQGP